MENSLKHDRLFLIFQSVIIILPALLIGSFNTKSADGAIGAPNLSSVLPLPTGFNSSLASLLNSSRYGTQVYGYETEGLFVPLLSSSGYINSTTSNDGYGFAFGILGNYDDAYNFVVCAGFFGNTSNDYVDDDFFDDGTLDFIDRADYTVVKIFDGYSVLLWQLLDTEGRQINNSNPSLQVVTSSEDDLPELQLRDGTSMLWSVKDVGRMEMLDNGSLVIYDNTLTKVVWRRDYEINNSSVLLPGQKLMLGQQLISNNSVYSLRLHVEGLSLNLNAIKYHDSSYLFLPFNDNHTAYSVCTEASTYITYITDNAQMLKLQANYPLPLLFLFARSCSHIGENASVVILESALSIQAKNFNFSFVTLGNDGYLYLVGVIASLEYLSTETYKFTYAGVIGSEDSYVRINSFQEDLWPGCEAPMACGPMGVCTARAQSPCSCPSLEKAFTFYNHSDQVQGCKRILALPDCDTSSNTSSKSKSDEISFLQLNHTGSVLLLSQSPHFNYDLFGSIDQCKINCSSTCQCQGFFFDPNVLPRGGCYFIREDVGSLLNISVSVYVEYDDYSLFKDFNTSLSTFLKIVSTPSQDKVKGKIVSTPSPNKINIKVIVLIITSILISSFLILSGLAFVLQRKKRKLRTLQILEERELQNIIPSMVTRFSYKDLHKSTHSFNDSNILGVGGCGAVYKGALVDGRLVAIKMLGFSNVLTKEQTKQFLAELACVSSTSHYNIVRLLGFCWENSQLLVVYEYLERGSLDQCLFNPKTSPPLDWKTRFNMTIGIAQGMHYLHEQCTKPILHLDVKPQNILLDQDFVPKLADFGLSKLVNQRDISQVITGVRGTPGYIAPEWVSHGAVSKKADVYSMGMVLLEIVSGRRNVDLSFLDNNMDIEKWYFPSWAARKCEQGLIAEIVDKELQGDFDDKEVQRVVFTSFWCINEDPCVRPSMGLVLQWLNGVSPITTPNFSSIYAHERSLMKPPLQPSQLAEFDPRDSIPFLSSSTNPTSFES